MRRLLPDSLGGWVFTVVAAAVILLYGSFLIASLIFRDGQAAAVAASQAADQLIVLTRVIDRTEPRERRSIVRGLNSPGLRMVVSSRPFVEESDDVFTSRIVFRRLEREFPEGTDIRTDSRIVEAAGEERFPTPDEVRREMRRFQRDMGRYHRELANQLPPNQFSPEDVPEPPEPPRFDRNRPATDIERRTINIDRALREIRGFQPFVRASIQVGESSWLNARIDLDLSEVNQRTQSFLILTSVMTLLITILAIWAVSRTTQPVSLFATAAERLGIGLNAEPLPETGTGEVRRAARAFNTMQSRLKRFIQDRTQMLAAISHDLRTPITRMRLRAEFVDDDEQRDKMLADLDEMESMIRATLAFARDDPANESSESSDVAAIVKDIVEHHGATGATVNYSGPDTLAQTVRPMGLKRALNNLIENAVKYGGCARVMLQSNDDHTLIEIEDDGPGIPDEVGEDVFNPFYRVEDSRSRNTGGTGLGMTIARNAVRSMGGDIQLTNRPEGGLKVEVTLPLGR